MKYGLKIPVQTQIKSRWNCELQNNALIWLL